ncbi:hypothetical protein [Actinomadura napierensis]|uniref:Uncharacterized protein n=1 Tax=Actinomadura napierensis TaxID=267854 RepID=A0ABN3AFZ9_9ACTN
MAQLSTYAEHLTREHEQWKAYESGIKKTPPGVLLQELLDYNKGAYVHRIEIPDDARDRMRKLAAISGDKGLRAIADRGIVEISLEEFRDADPHQTRLVVGWEIGYTPEEAKRLGLGPKSNHDPRNTIIVES